MKTVITDYSFPSLDIEEAILRPSGTELVVGQCKTTETLIPLVRDADAVITQFAPINREVIESMERAQRPHSNRHSQQPRDSSNKPTSTS